MFFKKPHSGKTFVPENITKDWLDNLLREQGTLTRGRVTSVVMRRRFVHHHSDILFLEVHYSSDTEPKLPGHWVLKIRTHSEGVSEVKFYQQATASRRTDYLPKAGAFKSWDSGESVLLLESLQGSHKLAVTDNQVFNQSGWRPSYAVLEDLIQAIAGFHGHWWNVPELKNHPQDYNNILEHQLPSFKHKVQPDDRVMGLLKRAIDDIPLFLQRVDEPQITLVHGDCFPWHFFLERAGKDVRLFDFEFSMVHSPAYDLVSLLSYWQGDYLKWFRKYHDALVCGQVADYPFERLLADIKPAIAAHTLRSVFDWHRGCSQALWKTPLAGLSQMLQAVDNHEIPY